MPLKLRGLREGGIGDHRLYHGCWCPGSWCCEVISSHGIDAIEIERLNSDIVGQNHVCWCPGSWCCQVISSHGIDAIEAKRSSAWLLYTDFELVSEMSLKCPHPWPLQRKTACLLSIWNHFPVPVHNQNHVTDIICYLYINIWCWVKLSLQHVSGIEKSVSACKADFCRKNNGSSRYWF